MQHEVLVLGMQFIDIRHLSLELHGLNLGDLGLGLHVLFTVLLEIALSLRLLQVLDVEMGALGGIPPVMANALQHTVLLKGS